MVYVERLGWLWVVLLLIGIGFDVDCYLFVLWLIVMFGLLVTCCAGY